MRLWRLNSRLPSPPAAKATVLATALLLAGCNLPGRPKPGPEVPRPEEVMLFDALYGQSCAGCHGVDGQNGPATNLRNPEYQAWIDDATLRDVIVHGQRGTLMPGFGKAGGGDLTDAQVDVLVSVMRRKWAQSNVLAGANPPPYKASHQGDPGSGQQVYAAACARCHGATAQQPGPAGSILDGSFLALITDQTIRTTIVAGRPDIGQPDWRGLIPGRALTDAEVTDVAAWLMSNKPQHPGEPYPNTQPTSQKPGEGRPANMGPANTGPAKR